MAGSDHHPGSRQGAPLVFDELRWVIQIRHSLQEDGGGDDDDNGIPVSVFNVPRQLQVHKPEAYVPQFIALGPYHHWRPELYEMERYKLAAARRAQRHLCAGVKFDHLVEQFARLERKVRAYYHRYLDFSGETLAWMMVVDGAFLLEFLQIFAAAEDGGGGKPALRRVSSRMAHLVDFAGRKSAHNLILRDMLMLENQMPLFLLRKILEPQCSSAEEAGELLGRMVTGLMKELCPFKMMDNFPSIDVAKHAHLLELLYYLLVPKPADDSAAADATNGHDEGYDIEEQPVDGGGGGEEKPPAGCEYVKQLFAALWGIVSNLKSGPMQYVAKPISFAVKAPWKMLTVVPGFSAMKHPVESFFMSGDGSSSARDPSSTAGHHISRPPLIEEIMIPSVSELASAGVQFVPANGDISTVAFDAKTATFHLPVVTLDSNTEVVLRNLVAYEASAASGPLVLTRYTELMNGIIDTDEDVALLRRRGVVLNRMKSDGEVAKLWNGMSRSVRLTRVAFMDSAVEEVNRYYDGRWRMKTKRFMLKYVFSSWQLLTFLAAIMMLLLTTLQAFCSVYTCSRWFGAVVSPPA
ncbi:hypothetical protein E2562_039212 [Oryza meyeriana var. granulata]|uniref:Uncharacterized protein n=1 Tax=Oryza meyeriana var. granulata TaxID=110450 RepID=A0A6G1CWV6_9ORYZ|nr:hypothetical protein E2562_039212 [Oryza meyeriana var. granulata]